MFNWRRRGTGEQPAVLDGQYLARLETHLGKAELRELLSDGLLELTDRVARLPKLAEADDSEGLAHLLHDIVGMAGHLGLTRLSHAAVATGRVLQGAKPGEPDVLNPVLEAAPEAISAIRCFLDGGSQD